jgi:hypothetical protein
LAPASRTITPLVAITSPLVADPSPFVAIPRLLVAVPRLLVAVPRLLVAIPRLLVAVPRLLVAIPRSLISVAGTKRFCRPVVTITPLIATPRPLIPTFLRKSIPSMGSALIQIYALRGILIHHITGMSARMKIRHGFRPVFGFICRFDLVRFFFQLVNSQ